ncbi:DUF1799 domain-containing protein [Enterobacter cloacae]|uniref:DUF1799 domain-containing protein n=1 Tax=Enterobacter cloacae TaxID=550 RepID=UPI000BD21226|nr:DUF1799 domain-containing protein [Enterobacter cloacae]PCM83481.1 hypothetical protein CP903_00060 [Enterobacter cloacae]
MTLDDLDDVEIDVLPDVWPAFCIFRDMFTQWRTSVGGVTGLDYNVLPWMMKIHGIDDEAGALQDVRVMEAAALRTIHKNQNQ